MKNYVKKYKGYIVPEGAVYYGPVTDNNYETFYDKDKLKLSVRVGDEWVEVTKVISFRDDLIELPTEEEWVPEAGEWYQIDHTDFEVFYVGTDSFGYHILEFENGAIEKYVSLPLSPIKSEREEFIEYWIDNLSGNGVRVDTDQLGLMYDKGARIVRGDDE